MQKRSTASRQDRVFDPWVNAKQVRMFLIHGVNAEQVRKHYWYECQRQKIPFVACRRGRERSIITVDMQPTYNGSLEGWYMTEREWEFILGLYRKYVPKEKARGTSASGGRGLIVIDGVPTSRAEACLQDIVECLKDRFERT